MRRPLKGSDLDKGGKMTKPFSGRKRKMTTSEELEKFERNRIRVKVSLDNEKKASGFAYRNKWVFNYPAPRVFSFSKAQLEELRKAKILFKVLPKE